MKNIRKIYLAALVVLLSPMAANADNIVVNSGVFWGTTGGVGGGRAQGIRADSTFSISSLGIFGNLDERSFDVLIYASTTGSDVGSVLASSTATVGGTGNGWNDININYTFGAGLYYIVNWRPTIDAFSEWAITLDYYNDSGLPTTVGPMTLVDGLEGYNAESSGNFLHPNFRYNIVTSVPEPGTLALLGLGLAGIGFAKRKKA
jgi:hypothetical protein